MVLWEIRSRRRIGVSDAHRDPPDSSIRGPEAAPPTTSSISLPLNEDEGRYTAVVAALTPCTDYLMPNWLCGAAIRFYRLTSYVGRLIESLWSGPSLQDLCSRHPLLEAHKERRLILSYLEIQGSSARVDDWMEGLLNLGILHSCRGRRAMFPPTM